MNIPHILAFLKAHSGLLIGVVYFIASLLIFFKGMVTKENLRKNIWVVLLWCKEAFEGKDGKTSATRVAAAGIFNLLAYAVYKAVNRPTGFTNGSTDIAIIGVLASALFTTLGIAGVVSVKNKAKDGGDDTPKDGARS